MKGLTNISVEVLQPSYHSNKIENLWWIALPFILYVSGLAICVYEFIPVEMNWLPVIALSLIQLICIEIAFKTGKHIISFLPFVILILLFSPMAAMRGVRGILNCMIIAYNNAYDGIAAVFPGDCSVKDCQAVMSLILLLLGYLMLESVEKEVRIVYDFSLAVVAVIMLFLHQFNSTGMALMVTSRVMLAFYNHNLTIPKGRVISMILTCAFFIGTAFTGGSVNDITRIRESSKEKIHDLRYGKNVLPRGNLYDTSMLKSSDEEMLQVTTEQEKNLYLRGFVGSQYSDGQWKEESTDSYSGEYEGMLTWLSERNFDPLYQVSAYYRLCDKSAQPEKNSVSVSTKGASREFFYSPMSLYYSNARGIGEDMDQKFRFTSLLPLKRYTETEMSFAKPSELMITEDWVENPETDEQKEYVNAESTYRNFVYNTYAVADSKLYERMNEMFWQDYSSDTDGIYSAVTHIRKCLEKLDCKEEIESSSEDPLVLFLNEQIKGNDVFYATAAVQALRAHGLPARYVEGYYVSENMIRSGENGNISISGRNQHAWVEIYFDGIGWLPVDFTPGYYYDSVKLQGMVISPNVVRKTAMYASEKLEPEKFTDETYSNKMGDLWNQISNPENVPMILGGILAIAVILVTLFGVIAELLRVLFIHRMQKIYAHADIKKKCILMEKSLRQILRTMGISFTLGHDSELIDKMLSERIEGIEKGQFLTVKDLMEKVLYGEEVLELYELRTLEYFFTQLTGNKQKTTWKEKNRKWFFVFSLYHQFAQ